MLLSFETMDQMTRSSVFIGAVVGAGAVAICAPELRAYRTLVAISRSLREGAAQPTSGRFRAAPSTRQS